MAFAPVLPAATQLCVASARSLDLHRSLALDEFASIFIQLVDSECLHCLLPGTVTCAGFSLVL